MGLFDWLRKPKKDVSSAMAVGSFTAHYAWIAERIGEVAAIDLDAPTASRRLQEMLDAYAALSGKEGGESVFGMAMSAVRLEPAEQTRLAADLRAAIVDARAKLDAKDDAVGLYEISKAAGRLDIPELRLTRRHPLRCDPLGSTEGLSPEWKRRIERLVRARDQKLSLNWQAVDVTVREDDEEPFEVELAPPNLDALYTFALRYEAELDATFSRELAAIYAVADGICIDGWWFLARVSDWTYEDEGLQIGSGSYSQGSLRLEPDAGVTELAEVAVVMRDDDGEVTATFDGLGALMDRLLTL